MKVDPKRSIVLLLNKARYADKQDWKIKAKIFTIRPKQFYVNM
jgi:hypothetical protein